MAHDGPPRQALAAALGSLVVRSLAVQVATAVVVAALVYLLVSNAAENLVRQGIASGFGFLRHEAGYDVGETWIQHSARNTYAHTLFVGFLNTLYVSVLGIAFATLLGIVVGVARVSRNWLIARLSAVYVEVFRNTPLLLQIVFWYTVMRQLPPPRQALHPFEGVFLSNRGLVHAIPVWTPVHGWMLAALLVGVGASLALGYWSRRRREATGASTPVLWPSLALVLGLPVGAWLLGGAPSAVDLPALRGFNFRGGATHSPEFVALLTSLVAYISAFIGEIVRAGIQAVAIGQREAARSLGLREGLILRLIVIPQALRVIVPPLTSQYLNLVKDSSLAVWIGYPDLVSVANTAINQTGQAVEGIVIMMTVYLTISLSISLFMNWYNSRVALRG
ncbi:MAG: ABC transporter permease subunit [Proteobacteria bacterium]|nr:ABC transporter permease subunit [Pseudomonadota bacterium]